jgi:DNA helicase HerA-like ATPase
MGTETTLAQVLADGYGFDDDALILGRPLDPGLDQPLNDHYVQVPLRMLNRHGLVAGATGTGKTKTLQVMAEQLSRAGVPVFLADLKGDLTGLAVAGTGNEHIDARMTGMDLPWHPEAFPVELLSITGEVGTPLRVPLSSFGPLLLAKVLDCTQTQESVLQVIFKYADEAQLALLDLVDLIEVLRYLTTDEGKALQSEYGGMSTQTINVLLRKAMELQTQGGDTFFGEPEFDVADLQRTDGGKGVISIMNLVDVQTKPRIFSTFMMWLLAEIYESSPEVGDQPAPQLVFFFDEAHLLFDGASKTLRESIELTVRMIRSKGIGVFFVTQQPRDVPDDVLAQLGNRVQHALRAYTPQDHKALKATAATFPVSDHYAVPDALTGLGTGEALITVLGPKGRPTPTVPTRLVAPVSFMDQVDAEVVRQLMAASPLRERYAAEVDRESAAELLAQRAEARAAAAAAHERAQEEAEALAKREKELAARQQAPSRSRSRSSSRRSRRASPAERMIANAASSIGREVGRSLIRGVLGNLGR